MTFPGSLRVLKPSEVFQASSESTYTQSIDTIPLRPTQGAYHDATFKYVAHLPPAGPDSCLENQSSGEVLMLAARHAF